MSDLHVLMLPSFYHTREKPYAGTFFHDWALALARAGVRVGVGYVEGRVFAFTDLQNGDWYVHDAGVHWPTIRVAFHQTGP